MEREGDKGMNLLPLSVSFRQHKADPSKYEVFSFESFKVLGFLGSGSEA